MNDFQQLLTHFDKQELLEAKRMMRETTKEASEMAASIHKKHGVWTVLSWKEAA